MKNRIGISTLSSAGVVALTLLFWLPLLSQSKKIQTDKLAQESDVIVVGKVGALTSEWADNKSRIQTRVTLSIEQTLKGESPGSSITVIIQGGEVDGQGEWYSHTIRFEKNEDVVLFADKDAKGNYHVAGGEQGKFSIKKQDESGARFIPNVGTLDEFTTEIKQSIKNSKTNKTDK